jgi:DNA invertase Pin-like site-specific DNA recombinase
VSTIDQHTDRQLAGIDVEKMFTDKASGKDVNRPELQAALGFVREGDTLVVHSMDRLARNLGDLRATVTDLTGRGVTVEFVKEHLEFKPAGNSNMDTLLLNVMGAFAEFERALSKERQREGIEQAKLRGAYKGRKPVLNPEQIAELRARAAAGEPKTVLARHFGIGRATVYNYLSTSGAVSIDAPSPADQRNESIDRTKSE